MRSFITILCNREARSIIFHSAWRVFDGDVDGPPRSPLPPRFRRPLPMASPPPPPTSHPSLLHEIGPDGIARESPVIAYTEKIIEAEQLQLKRYPKGKTSISFFPFLFPASLLTKVFTICPRYIQENYSKIRDVERDLESLTLELKLTAGPKKAGFCTSKLPWTYLLNS
ncbi:hypothetical protein BHE74_00032644 [Ensete ventricosum]|nr:hypothetical protein BHE74_00032644 [Ensete ventricosum]